MIALYREVGIKKTFEKILQTVGSKIYIKNEDLIMVKNLNEDIKLSKENKLQVQPITKQLAPLLVQLSEKYREQEATQKLIGYLNNGILF